MNRSLVRTALAEARRAMPTTWPTLVVRSSSRNVVEGRSGQRIRKTIVELGSQGHVLFLGRIRPER